MAQLSPSAHILVVDDSDEIRECYRLVLEQAGYRVTTAGSGKDGLAILRDRRSRPELLIVDIVMPAMDGFEFLMHLRSDLVPPIPPSIVCSGFEVTEEEALRRGAFAFVRKPIDPDSLLQIIRLALAGQKPTADLIATSLSRNARMRQSANLAAQALMANVDIASLNQRYSDFYRWLGAYFRVGAVLVVGVRADRLVILNCSGPMCKPLGENLDASLGPCRDVIESGETLIATNARQHVCFSSARPIMQGIGSFAGVPVRATDGVVFAVLCLVDEGRREYAAEDVYILECIGRRATDILQYKAGRRSLGGPPSSVPGILTSQNFRMMLELELRLAQQHESHLEFAVFEVADEEPLREWWNEFLEDADWERRAVGWLGPRRIGVYKRAAKGSEAARAVMLAYWSIDRTSQVLAVGAVACDGSQPLLGSADDLLRIGDRLLNQSLMLYDHAVVRLVLRNEPWSGLPDEPADRLRSSPADELGESAPAQD